MIWIVMRTLFSLFIMVIHSHAELLPAPRMHAGLGKIRPPTFSHRRRGTVPGGIRWLPHRDLQIIAPGCCVPQQAFLPCQNSQNIGVALAIPQSRLPVDTRQQGKILLLAPQCHRSREQYHPLGAIWIVWWEKHCIQWCQLAILVA